MAAKKSGLGRGLGSLITSKTVAEEKLTSQTGGQAANKPGAVQRRCGRKKESDLEGENVSTCTCKRKPKENWA